MSSLQWSHSLSKPSYMAYIRCFLINVQRIKQILNKLTSLKGFCMTASSCQSAVLQILRVLSSDCDDRYLPTGSHVTPFTSPVCPFRIATTSGNFCASQMITVLSTEQVASQLSCGDHAMSRTSPSCLFSVETHRHDSTLTAPLLPNTTLEPEQTILKIIKLHCTNLVQSNL